MSRTHALLDLIAGFDPDRTLFRVLATLSKACHATADAIDVPVKEMATIRQCVEEGATVHKAPGAIDRIVLAPEAAVFLLCHGAQPGKGWVAELLRWVEESFHSGNDLNEVPHPQTPNEWLCHAVRRSITLCPGLDWMVAYKSEVSSNREIFIDRLSLRDREVVRHLRQARALAHVPLVPLQGDKALYTQMLSDVLDEYPRHRLLWQDLGTDQVARDLLGKGADPSRIWPTNSAVSRDDPFLVRALFKDPDLVQVLLDKGAQVSVRVVDDLGRALVDRQRRLMPGPETAAALKALLERMPREIDPDTRPVEGASGRSLGMVIEQAAPGLLDECRAAHQAYRLDQATRPLNEDQSTPRRL